MAIHRDQAVPGSSPGIGFPFLSFVHGDGSEARISDLLVRGYGEFDVSCDNVYSRLFSFFRIAAWDIQKTSTSLSVFGGDERC